MNVKKLVSYDIITPFCYKFIQVTACKNSHTRPQLD